MVSVELSYFKDFSLFERAISHLVVIIIVTLLTFTIYFTSFLLLQEELCSLPAGKKLGGL